MLALANDGGLVGRWFLSADARHDVRIGELRHVKALGGGGRDSIVGRRGTLTKTGPALSRKRSTFVQYSTQNPPEIGPARKARYPGRQPRSVGAGRPAGQGRARAFPGTFAHGRMPI